MRDPQKYIDKAQALLELGFQSNAARKRAMEQVGWAYDAVRDAVHTEIIRDAWAAFPGTDMQSNLQRGARFTELDMPFSLAHVRDKHFTTLAGAGYVGFAMVRDLIALRETIREAPVAPPPPVNATVERVNAVRRTIVEEMERRKAVYLEGLDMARHLGGLAVTVNAHRVHGHKGAVFDRHFFYLRGKLTPLNTIVAIAEQLEREKEQPASAGGDLPEPG